MLELCLDVIESEDEMRSVIPGGVAPLYLYQEGILRGGGSKITYTQGLKLWGR